MMRTYTSDQSITIRYSPWQKLWGYVSDFFNYKMLYILETLKAPICQFVNNTYFAVHFHNFWQQLYTIGKFFKPSKKNSETSQFFQNFYFKQFVLLLSITVIYWRLYVFFFQIGRKTHLISLSSAGFSFEISSASCCSQKLLIIWERKSLRASCSLSLSSSWSSLITILLVETLCFDEVTTADNGLRPLRVTWGQSVVFSTTEGVGITGGSTEVRSLDWELFDFFLHFFWRISLHFRALCQSLELRRTEAFLSITSSDEDVVDSFLKSIDSQRVRPEWPPWLEDLKDLGVLLPEI